MFSRVSVLVWMACFLCPAAACVAQENIGGVGVAVRAEDGRVFVNKLIQGGPADVSGEVHEGDRLLAVADGDGAAVKVGPTIPEATRLLKGPIGSAVRLTIVPAGKGESDARVVRLVRAQLKHIWGDGKLLAEGADAPDLELARLPDGRPERLADHRGKVVVLVFWASWCGPCQSEMAGLQTLPAKHPEWKDKVVLLPLSVDEDKANPAKHLKDKEWNKTHNVWGGEAPLRTYHVEMIPTTYVINAEGKVAAAAPQDVEAAVAKLVK